MVNGSALYYAHFNTGNNSGTALDKSLNDSKADDSSRKKHECVVQ